MVTSNTGWLQEVLVLTSLLANHSDFAAVDTSSPVPSFSPTGTSLQSQFTVPASADVGAAVIPNIHDPEAINAQTVCPGYLATSIDVTAYGLQAHLSLAGESCNAYGTDVSDLDLVVEYQAQSRLHVKIKPSVITSQNESWYMLPEAWVPAPQQEAGSVENSDLSFSWINKPTFGFNVTRKSTKEVLFSTDGSKLVFENQFIEFVTSMNEGYNIYGLGEVICGLRLQSGLTRTLYAADAGNPIDGNIYGNHPFYLQTKYYEVDQETGEKVLLTKKLDPEETTSNYTSTSHGVYLRNAHAMEILMNPTNVTWRTIGGIIDLYFFNGPTQPEVTSQYISQIGLPVMQQYWTFGYHQCRWGYHNWSETEKVVNDMNKFDIPLETIWNDIDYMNHYRDFDNDPERFPYDEGAEFLNRLHDKGQHYIPIVDSAIYVPNPETEKGVYPVFDTGYKTGSFMLNPDGTLYIGQVWPGFTVFPDWHEGAAEDWWQTTMAAWHEKLPFDGIWIDMSEVSSFCTGSCGSYNLTLNPVHPWFQLPGEPGNKIYDYPEGFNITNATEAASASAASSTQAAAASMTAASTVSPTSYLRTTPTLGIRDVNHPPYALNHIFGDLAEHTISPNATHHSGVQEYDVHNLFGHQILQNTYAAISKINPGFRPFIIGRSTFVGSGNYSGHWGGDNASKFYYMYFSIPQALSMSLFGIPMFGVDTCGFSGNTDEELCNRWMQLSALFPFYRNHNDIGAVDQEPYRWASVIEATKIAMNIRFQLLPYLYTLFYNAHTKGETVMRALAWEFPNYPSLADADRQFFLGPAILVTPVLIQGHTAVSGVFPGLVEGTDVYYDWYNQSAVCMPSKKNTTIDAPLGHIPVYIRGGHILATQQMAMTTRDARKTDWSLIIALDISQRATGKLYLDDGASITPNATKIVTMEAQLGIDSGVSRLRIDVDVDGEFTGLDLPLGNVTVLGVPEAPANMSVWVDGEEVDAFIEYCPVGKKLVVSGLQHVLNGRVWAKKWSLTM
ncbi:hypothetical protein H2198_008690 [Neophaeococcomyces mojaviensis]|uniref:Uncharacterized protein n=1 Tax=Neophaeococcomyces mojaviensis TaxID=3383035 RepID=A0ACC2ZWU1_9EURO|nr:hypothetical protein H2198_008690 [Knufia sp. JES_112]